MSKKDFSWGLLKASVQDGCAIKYDKENEFKLNGKATFTVGDSTNTTAYVIHLDKGKIITSNSTIILESSINVVKVRLLNGNATYDNKGKQITLEKNKVLTVGG
jgi:hypothetical protein